MLIDFQKKTQILSVFTGRRATFEAAFDVFLLQFIEQLLFAQLFAELSEITFLYFHNKVEF